MMSQIYKLFRNAGARSAVAFTAAYAAVRVGAWRDSNITSWMYLIGPMSDHQMADFRCSLASVTPKR